MTPADSARILAPVDRPDEVEALAEAGAHELYGGVLPRDWTGGALSANQRTFEAAQFPSEGAFAAAAARATRAGVDLYLALNGGPYASELYPELVGLARRAADWGVAGVIAGDLGLLLRLARERPAPRLVLSTLAGALNRAAVSFYRRFGVGRVVLPRHLGLGEMGALAAAHPDLAFEAFVLVGRCPNEEAYCTFQHTSPQKRWPCEIPYELSAPPDHPLSRWHRTWAGVDRRLACGLCAVPELLASGIRHLKVVGRGGPTEVKVANVRLVASFAAGDRSPEEVREAYRARFGRPCHPHLCYFPEFHPAAGALMDET